MGGVLVDLDLTACKDAFRELGFKEVDTVFNLSDQKTIFGLMEEGLVSADEFRNHIIAGSDPGVTPDDVDFALGRILAGISPYKIEMLRRLSADYDLYILSNINPIAISFARKMFREAGFSLESDFRKCYFSCEMKALKPSEDFYKEVMSDIGLTGSEMLFIDDTPVNVDAANETGLPALHYVPGTDLDKLLTDYLK